MFHDFIVRHRDEIYARSLPNHGCVFTVDLPRLVVSANAGAAV